MPTTNQEITEIDSQAAQVETVLRDTQARFANARGGLSAGDEESVMLAGAPIGGPLARDIARLQASETELKKTLRTLFAQKTDILQAEALLKQQRAEAAYRETERKVQEAEISLANKRRELEAMIPAELSTLTDAVNEAVSRRAEARTALNTARSNESRVEDLTSLNDELSSLGEAVTREGSALHVMLQDLRVATVTGNARNEATLKQRVADLERRLPLMKARKLDVEQAIAAHEITVARAELGAWETALRKIEGLREAKRLEIEAEISRQLQPLRMNMADAVADRQRAAAELQIAKNGVERAAKGKAA